MDPKTINYIKNHPNEADALANQWQGFANRNPEVLSFKTAEEFNMWATQHPEKHIDTNIWIGKEITDVYFNLKRQQEDSGTQAQGSSDKKEDRQREETRETPGESISQPTAPTTTYQPSIQTPTRGFFDRGIGRAPSRLGGKVATRSGSMTGRLASRLAAQAGMAAGRAAVQGIVAGAGAIGVVGWIVILVIILIIVAVVLIIMFFGGGGGSAPALPRLYECKFGGFPTSFPANCNSGPPVRCVGPGTGELVSVDAPDGNTCAANAAVNYSEIEGVTITTKCVDKCIDNSVTNICEPDISNACPDPNPKCGGATGVVLKTFCIEYTIVPATPTPTPAPGEIVFPASAGVINVKDPLYAAKGDGATDDTAAIQKAVSDGLFLSKDKERTAIIYFPAGTYLVSNTILPKIDPAAIGGWSPYLTLQGQARDKTIIKLKDNAPGYSDKSSPKAVLYTASASFVCKDVSAGGNVEWINKGECNEAYHNYISDLTVDTGKGNLGAIGIDYLANNNGAVENVRIVSGDGQGYIGLALIRRWQGPALIKNVTVEGFDYGIGVNDVYSMTLEHITLKNQKVAGLRNIKNMLSIRDLQSVNSVPVIINDLSTAGLIVLVDANLQGIGAASSLPAIDNIQGELFARNVAAPGYSSVIRNKGAVIPGTSIIEFYSLQGNPLYKYSLFDTPEKSLNLPVQETPEVPWDPPDQWVNVQDYGADGSGKKDFDNTPAVQAAIDDAARLGKTTLYFPKGQYAFGDTIRIYGSIRRVHFMMSSIGIVNSSANKFGDGRPASLIDEGDHPVLVIQGGGGGFDTGATVKPRFGAKHISSKTLVLKNSGGNYENVAGSGPVFFEDRQSCGVFRNTKVWTRQMDPEACTKPPDPAFDPKIVNDGSDLWILGLKTEGAATIVETRNGGKTEALGGFIAPIETVPPGMPAFRNVESSHSLSFIVHSSGSQGFHEIVIEETRDGETRQATRSQFPPRGNGVMVPFFAGYK